MYFISPDDLWIGPSNYITFIYNTAMYYGNSTHKAILQSRFQDLIDHCKKHNLNPYHTIQRSALLGRVGTFDVMIDESGGITEFDVTSGGEHHKIKVVTFWSAEPELYNKLLKGCLDRLLEDGHIDESCYVSTPLLGTIPISKFDLYQPKVLSHAQQMQLNTREELHQQAGTIQADKLKKQFRGNAIRNNQDPLAKHIAPVESVFERKLNIILESL